MAQAKSSSTSRGSFKSVPSDENQQDVDGKSSHANKLISYLNVMSKINEHRSSAGKPSDITAKIVVAIFSSGK